MLRIAFIGTTQTDRSKSFYIKLAIARSLPTSLLTSIVAPIPDIEPDGKIDTRVVSRYVLDQDTGSAIEGAARVDIFLGSGEVAEERAELLNGSGNLFYLLLKD